MRTPTSTAGDGSAAHDPAPSAGYDPGRDGSTRRGGHAAPGAGDPVGDGLAARSRAGGAAAGTDGGLRDGAAASRAVRVGVTAGAGMPGGATSQEVAPPAPTRGRVSRRGLLAGGAALLGGVLAARGAEPAQAVISTGGFGGCAISGTATVPCWGEHQAGVETPAPAFASFVALNLKPGTTRADLVRLMRLWTDDIERLTQGRPAMADGSPQLADVPASLTVTVGYGPGVFAVRGLAQQRPSWLAPLPHFSIDKLQPEWSGGDVLLQIRADDPIAVSHAQRVLLTDATGFAEPHWIQPGFQRAAGMTSGGTGRNLFGQVDGTVNATPGTDDFARVVWSAGQPDWLAGGTGFVLRRISMDLATWAGIETFTREQSMGRRMDSGAPLTGAEEFDTIDFEARDAGGLLVIPEFAHVRLAHAQNPEERILRRPYNYDAGFADGTADAGLLFAAFAADVDRQFVPIQERLATIDMLNLWTTPIGSAVFAIPPGWQPGGFVGDTLLA